MILLLALASLQDELWRLKPGTEWTYTRVQGGDSRVIEAKVLDDKDGRVLVDWKEKDGDHSELTWIVKDGLLWAEARAKGGEQVILRFPVLKTGAKKDDTWTTDIGESKHHGTEDVKVPAGTYKDAVRTQLAIGDGTLVDFHLAPKVGLVKVSVVPAGGGDVLSFELKEFKPAP